MKRMICEICGGSDLQKEDGVFVCNTCGCKYSVEEVKKMMGDVNNNKKLENLYVRARKSLEVQDYEHVGEYFKEILDEKPHDWEAYFYAYLYEYKSYTNKQAESVVAKLGNTIPPAYDMAIVDCTPEEATERVITITKETTKRISSIAAAAGSLLSEYASGIMSTAEGRSKADMYYRMRPLVVDTVVRCLDTFDIIEKKVEELLNGNNELNKDKLKDALLFLRKGRFNLANKKYFPTSDSYERLIKGEVIHDYAVKVQELDPSFHVPSIDSLTNKSGGCYVATAVYGSYDCPEVWTLRRFRDYDLAGTWYGRVFVRTYYAISPTLVKWFGHTEWFKKMWKGKLDRMVKNLQDKGYENTPYEDRDWR